MNSAKSNKPGRIDPDPFGSFLIASVLWGAVLILVGFAAFFGYKYFTADPPGYCRAQDRYISDEEFLETAVAVFEWDMNRDIKYYPGGEVIKKRDKFASMYDQWFRLRGKPECCAVLRDKTYPIGKRMFNRQEVEIRLNYKRASGQITVPFTICGTMLNRDNAWLSFYGTHRMRNVMPTTRNYKEFIAKYPDTID